MEETTMFVGTADELFDHSQEMLSKAPEDPFVIIGHCLLLYQAGEYGSAATLANKIERIGDESEGFNGATTRQDAYQELTGACKRLRTALPEIVTSDEEKTLLVALNQFEQVLDEF